MRISVGRELIFQVSVGVYQLRAFRGKSVGLMVKSTPISSNSSYRKKNV